MSNQAADQSEVIQWFYNLCSDPLDRLNLKKQLLLPSNKKKLTPETLGIGLCSAVLNQQENLAEIILDVIPKYGIILPDDFMYAAVNMSFLWKKKDISRLLDEKFQASAQFLSQPQPVALTLEGKLDYVTLVKKPARDEILYQNNHITQMLPYMVNPLIFHCLNGNTATVHHLLEHAKELNTSLVESAFIQSCELLQLQCLKVLCTHEKTNPIIHGSVLIQRYLNNKSENIEVKNCVNQLLANNAMDISFTIPRWVNLLTATRDSQDAIYELCKDESNLLVVKKLFLFTDFEKKISPEKMGLGLFSAIEHQQTNIFSELLELCESKGMQADMFLRASFNMAASKDDIPMLQLLEKKTGITSQFSLSQGHYELNQNGTLHWVGGLPDEHGHQEQGIQLYYAYDFNPLIFCAVKQHVKSMEFILDNALAINHALVEEAFLACCENNKLQSLEILWCHEKSKKLLGESPAITMFLNESTMHKTAKDFIRCLNQVEQLTQVLPQKSVRKTRPRI